MEEDVDEDRDAFIDALRLFRDAWIPTDRAWDILDGMLCDIRRALVEALWHIRQQLDPSSSPGSRAWSRREEQAIWRFIVQHCCQEFEKLIEEVTHATHND